MTDNEKFKCAIHCLRHLADIEECEDCDAYAMDDSACIEIAKEAIKALEEVQQYRAIGSVEECKAAVEKQKAVKPDYEGDGYADGHMVYDTWICPSCGEEYEVDYDDYDHCPKCGQAIDRTEEGEK